MSTELDASEHLYSALKGRLGDNDKQGEIDLYYELLTSGHSVGDILSAAREVAPPSDYLERFRFGKFPRMGKWVAFLVIYTVVVSFASIASFSILRIDRDAKPTTAQAQSDISSQTEAVAMPSPAAARLEAVVEPLIPSEPVSGSLQEAAAGVQETVSATPQEAEARQRSNADQPSASEQGANPAVAPGGPAHEPTTVAVQRPSKIPRRSAETAPHLDTGLPDSHEPPKGTPKSESQVAETVPTRNMSASLPSRGRIAKIYKANAPRYYYEPRRRTHKQAPEMYLNSMYYGQQPGSYYTDFNWGYGYGGPAPNSDTGG